MFSVIGELLFRCQNTALEFMETKIEVVLDALDDFVIILRENFLFYFFLQRFKIQALLNAVLYLVANC